MKALDVKNAKWLNSTKSLVECEVDFDEFESRGTYVLFAVDLKDDNNDEHVMDVKSWVKKNKVKISKCVIDVETVKLVNTSILENSYVEAVKNVVPYSNEEKQTFEIQQSEAKLYVADNSVEVPHLQILSEVNGVNLLDLATKIIEKSNAQNLELFRLLSIKQKALSDMSKVNKKSKKYDVEISNIVEKVKW